MDAWHQDRLADFNVDFDLITRQSWDGESRKVGEWREMTASLGGREVGSRGTSTVRSCYEAEQCKPWLRPLVCVWRWFVLKGQISEITNPDPVYSQSRNKGKIAPVRI
jgi:hypothetical protein